MTTKHFTQPAANMDSMWRDVPGGSKSTQDCINSSTLSARPLGAPHGHHRCLPTPGTAPGASSLPCAPSHSTCGRQLTPQLRCATCFQPNIHRMWANSCRASNDSKLLAHCLSGHPEYVPPSSRTTQDHVSMRARMCRLSQPSRSGLRRPVALRIMRLPFVSTLLLVVSLRNQP